MVRASGTRAQRIPMTSVKALTLHSDRETTFRRTSAVPQLTCKGKACKQYTPDVVQCTAVGEDGAGGLEWACTADLPNGVRFGAVEVSCEGWDGPDDPYILRGSCGLTYNLVRSHSALERDSSSFSSRYKQSEIHPLISLGSLLLFLYALYLLYVALLPRIMAYFRSTSTNPRRPRPWFDWFGGSGGGGGGGGGGGPGGPPPPYSSHPKQSTSEGWRPGFWTGALAGVLGGQAAARMRGQPGYEPAYPYRFRGGNTGMRPGYGLRDDGDWDRGVGGSGSWGRSTGGSGGSSGGSMRQSTGFGGTRNR